MRVKRFMTMQTTTVTNKIPFGPKWDLTLSECAYC